MAAADKYTEIFNSYHIDRLSDADINKKIQFLLDKKSAFKPTDLDIKTIFSCIEHTSLNSTDTPDRIWNIAEEVNNIEGSSDAGNIAGICVYPTMVSVLKEGLAADVKIVSVAAGFPSSQTFIEVKVAEVALAVANGADEIDVVLNLGLFLDGNYEDLCDEIAELKHACRDAKLKVILETGALQSAQNIMKASLLCLHAGVDFIKTSTGKEGYEGATLFATYVMCHAINEYRAKHKIVLGLKVAGGIRSVEQALDYYFLVKEVLGESYIKDGYFRIGTSKLFDLLKDSVL